MTPIILLMGVCPPNLQKLMYVNLIEILEENFEYFHVTLILMGLCCLMLEPIILVFQFLPSEFSQYFSLYLNQVSTTLFL